MNPSGGRDQYPTTLERETVQRALPCGTEIESCPDPHRGSVPAKATSRRIRAAKVESRGLCLLPSCSWPQLHLRVGLLRPSTSETSPYAGEPAFRPTAFSQSIGGTGQDRSVAGGAQPGASAQQFGISGTSRVCAANCSTPSAYGGLRAAIRGIGSSRGHEFKRGWRRMISCAKLGGRSVPRRSGRSPITSG